MTLVSIGAMGLVACGVLVMLAADEFPESPPASWFGQRELRLFGAVLVLMGTAAAIAAANA